MSNVKCQNLNAAASALRNRAGKSNPNFKFQNK